MKEKLKKTLCVLTAAALALPLTACSQETAESDFDDPLPWHDPMTVAVSGSYEKLDYSVTVFDTAKGMSESKRVAIADGTLSYTLTERPTETTKIDMTFSVTYSAPEKDKGCTDTIVSSTEFESNSLATINSSREASFAPREGEKDSSYKIVADYNSKPRKAVYTDASGKEKKLSLPSNTCHDNEMMFYIARAQKIGKGSSTLFYMTNLFDSFNNGKIVRYPMAVSGNSKKQNVNIGDWVKDFGVEAAKDDSSSYPVSCFMTSITINEEQHGPSYVVYYSEKPFAKNGKEHKKIPVRIEYSTYKNTKPYRLYRYDLTSCDFDKPVA